MVDLTWLTDQLATGGVSTRARPDRTIAQLMEERVDLVIDCRDEVDDRADWREAPIAYLRLPTADRLGHRIPARHFDRAIAAANPVLTDGGRVFVHCRMGVNRGPSTALALLLEEGMPLEEAVALIKRRRPHVGLAYVGDAVGAHEKRHPHWRRHYGHAGAGIAIVHDGRILLTKRSRLVQHPGTWSIPGGAVGRREPSRRAAQRELAEELRLTTAGMLYIDMQESACHRCGWTYETFIYASEGLPRPSRGWETAATSLVPIDDVHRVIRLHPGFAASWPEVRRLIERGLG